VNLRNGGKKKKFPKEDIPKLKNTESKMLNKISYKINVNQCTPWYQYEVNPFGWTKNPTKGVHFNIGLCRVIFIHFDCKYNKLSQS
jgi:hypothetical protein